ncbi:SMI1/KNR4 family protein [Nonomuraea maritima]|uniref:SMI1/KNR4 family protein n=1 Tax=Nonomuraea maritima TaxID=683260 RepID=UPI00371A0F69
MNDTDSAWRELLGRAPGFPAMGASEADIAEQEKRLGVRLPPGYRAFLRVANGWGQGIFRPVHEIGLVRALAPWLAELADPDAPYPIDSASDEDYFVYGDGQQSFFYRPEYLPDSILVGQFDDGDFFLNPHVISQAGEWEACYAAAWLPGVERHRSFFDLVASDMDRFKDFPPEAG